MHIVLKIHVCVPVIIVPASHGALQMSLLPLVAHYSCDAGGGRLLCIITDYPDFNMCFNPTVLCVAL